MNDTAVRTDGIRWQARARVEKYSDDQVAYAAREFGVAVPAGRLLQQLFRTPEDGIAEAPGNLLVTVGLTNITKLIIGSGGLALNQAQTLCGVGASTANSPLAADTALTDDNSANAWYQNVDSGSNPSQSSGVITAVTTFTTGNANFAWQEWCLAVTSGTITSGTHLSATASPSPTMINHKMYAGGSGLGTKTSGSWVLTATITLA